jgi:hypothetical protein
MWPRREKLRHHCCALNGWAARLPQFPGITAGDQTPSCAEVWEFCRWKVSTHSQKALMSGTPRLAADYPYTSAGARVCFGWDPSAAKAAQDDCLNRSGKPLRHSKAIGPHSHKTRMIRAPAGMPRAAMFIHHRLWAIKDLLSTYGLVLKPFKNRVASHACLNSKSGKRPNILLLGGAALSALR